MFSFFSWIKRLGLLLSFLLILASIVWAEKKQATRLCQAIDIAIAPTGSQRFVEEQALVTCLAKDYKSPILGTPMDKLVVRKIENSVNSHNFVRKSIAYKSWKGRLKIAVAPKRPIARILHLHKQSQYIDEEGALLPLSDQYTARALLIDGGNLHELGLDRDLKNSLYGQAFLKLLHLIDQDAFWRSQIIHISVNKKGKLFLTTQLGKQRIAFGRPESIEKKMKKLRLFYKVILPYKGWSSYKQVSLEFDNQIVCK